MRSLEQLDRWIAGKLKAWSSQVSGAPQSPHLLEIRRDILEDVRDRIQPVGAGKSVFPYNAISLRIGAGDSDQQVLQEAIFCGDNALEQDVRELLSEAGCPVPAGLSVTVAVVEDMALASTEHPYRIDFLRTREAARREAARNARPNAKLRVLQGESDAPEYPIVSDRVNIGRLKEVVGEREGLRRRNDIAFADSETTVSREHAYIRYNSDTGKFCLYDSSSQRGTAVFRQGRRLEVPKGAVRGVQLQSGDEIHVGKACLVFELSYETNPSPGP